MPVRVSNPVHLTVLDPIDTSFVTRLTSARRPAGEILQAFQIGGFGGVAFTTDPVERAKTHLMALIMTRIGERMMRPNFGSDVWSFLFEPASNFAASELSAQLTSAIQEFEPGLNVVSVQPSVADASGSYVAVEISFTLTGFSEVHTTTIDTSGNRIEI